MGQRGRQQAVVAGRPARRPLQRQDPRRARRQLVHDARRLHLRQRRAARLRAVRRRTRRRHRPRDGPQRTPSHGHASGEGASAEPARRHRVDLLAVHLSLRTTRRGGRDREDVARRRVAGRPVRRLPDVAGRLRSRRDGDVHAPPRCGVRRSRQLRRQVFRRSSGRSGSRFAPRRLQAARSQGADLGSGARAGAARPRRGPLRDREREVSGSAQDESERFGRAPARRSGRDRARSTDEERTDAVPGGRERQSGDADRRVDPA